MKNFSSLSPQSQDKQLKQFYTNFQKLIHILEEKNLYEQNADFYNQKILEVNEKISENFSEKYDLQAKNLIRKNFSLISNHIASKHKFFTKKFFMQLFLMIGIVNGIVIGFMVAKQSIFVAPIGFVCAVAFWYFVGKFLDNKMQKDQKQIAVALDDEN